jgi:hypothetical protein
MVLESIPLGNARHPLTTRQPFGLRNENEDRIAHVQREGKPSPAYRHAGSRHGLAGLFLGLPQARKAPRQPPSPQSPPAGFPPVKTATARALGKFPGPGSGADAIFWNSKPDQILENPHKSALSCVGRNVLAEGCRLPKFRQERGVPFAFSMSGEQQKGRDPDVV